MSLRTGQYRRKPDRFPLLTALSRQAAGPESRDASKAIQTLRSEHGKDRLEWAQFFRKSRDTYRDEGVVTPQNDPLGVWAYAGFWFDLVQRHPHQVVMARQVVDEWPTSLRGWLRTVSGPLGLHKVDSALGWCGFVGMSAAWMLRREEVASDMLQCAAELFDAAAEHAANDLPADERDPMAFGIQWLLVIDPVLIARDLALGHLKRSQLFASE